VLGCRITSFDLVALSDRFLTPLISSNVDEYAHKPRFFVRESVGDGARRTRSLEEGVLNKVESVIGVRDETSCEAIEPIPVRLEQLR
jgi:hypothetical protein